MDLGPISGKMEMFMKGVGINVWNIEAEKMFLPMVTHMLENINLESLKEEVNTFGKTVVHMKGILLKEWKTGKATGLKENHLLNAFMRENTKMIRK